MIELELSRTPGDRRLYNLQGVGTLRREGPLSRSATAEADSSSWRFSRRSLWRRVLQATDARGVVGEFVPRDIRRGGALRWGGDKYTLHPVSALRERYALRDGDRELVLIDGRSWGRRPVKITLAHPGEIEPGLLLFASFVVHELAVNAVNDSSAGGTAAVSGS
jgi:hypothetical protein